MPKKINTTELHQLSKSIPVIDVRSSKEFATGHIKNAHNIPIFSNEERAIVGTIYKQENKNNAILKGLEIVGPKLRNFVEQAQNLATENKLILYCWRGGMRSASMAWLFETAGLEIYILEKGYKAYRNYGKSLFSKTEKLIVLGGLTGSGKTETLQKLKEKNQQVVNLEELANHKGSVFGALGQQKQPGNEQFENNLLYEWLNLDLSKPVWVEDESHSIGSNWLPTELFNFIRKSIVIKMELDKKERIKRLVHEYASFDKKELEICILKIGKRLGGQNVKSALKSLENGELTHVVDVVLSYYDKTYNFGLEKRENNSVHPIHFLKDKPEKNAEELIKFSEKIF